MQAFARLEINLIRKAYQRDYYRARQEALEVVGHALANPSCATKSDVVFVSINFKGTWDAKGLKEFGIARLDAKSSFSTAGDPEIQTLDYILKSSRRQKFLFGEATRAHEGFLPQLIAAYFDELQKSSDNREIILVIHGRSDLTILQGLGLPLEDLGIAGIADTLKLSQLILGIRGSMGYLVNALHLPICAKLLHCAGNDANYTIRVLLALLERRYGDECDRLDLIARQPLPFQPSNTTKKAEDDWKVYLGNDGCLGLE